MASKNLKHFEEMLAGHSSFIRVHRSYLANLDKARKILNESRTEVRKWCPCTDSGGTSRKNHGSLVVRIIALSF
jgi:DNA-binding LytR/AlgR family response regulator